MAAPLEIIYEKIVITHDIPRLSREWSLEIKRAIEEKLASEPEVFGKPLRHTLKGHRTFRVGDYRVGLKISGRKIIIEAILHRSVMYRELLKRI